MLEQCDTEFEYNQLSESISTLIEARTTIEKEKEQIAQLKLIDENANKLNPLIKP